MSNNTGNHDSEKKLDNIEISPDIKILSDTYLAFRDEIKMHYGNSRKDTSLLLIIGGAIVTLLSAETKILDTNLLYAVLPSIIFLFTIIQIQGSYYISILSGTCAQLEDKINIKCKSRILDYERTIVPKHEWATNTVTYLIGVVLVVALILLFLWLSVKAYSVHGQGITFLHIIEFVILVVIGMKYLSFVKARNRTFSRLGKIEPI